MYLFPTKEEMDSLYRKINPTARIMDYLYSRPSAENSMAEFFMESEDIELAMEDDAMPYFDDIEDDIISMRRDVNGFKLHIPAPRYLEHNPNSGHLNFKGWTFEYVNRDTEQDIEILKTLPNSQFVDSWDDI